jgi:3-oxoacyl-[acyl-carrier-protein] synthase-3
MSKIRAAITGVGGYVPDYILTNHELSTMVETNDEWITTRTGIKERRILKGEGLGTSYMATKAVQELLTKTKTDPKDIDLIICATITPDHPFPATANLVADQVGAINSFSYDIICRVFRIFVRTHQPDAKYIESGTHKKGNCDWWR